MRRRLFLAILCGLGLPHPARAAAAPAAKVFVGYLFGSPRGLDFQRYTHLCHAFLVADGDGTLRKGRNVPDRALTKQAHESGVQVLVSLGGWGWDKQFGEIVADPTAEDRFVSGVLTLVDEYDYDGIDLDWEYPDTAKEVAGFERLSTRFREGLDALGKAKGRVMPLTMAASSNPETLKWLRKEFIVPTFSWMNVMTYDYAGDWTGYAGHNSPLFASSKVPGGAKRSCEQTVRSMLDVQGIPADKIALGIPLYGRAFAVKEPYAPTTQGAPKVRLPEGSYANLHKLLTEGKWTRDRDEETKVPWLLAPDGSAVVGYDDAESVALKTAWAMKLGLRGVFFWQVAADRLPDGSNPLQTASREAWEAGSAGTPPAR